MKMIYKFPVQPGVTKHVLPADAVILTVQVQRGNPFIWVLMDPSAPGVEVTLSTYGTGHPMPYNPGKYVGTFQLEDLGLVFHVFETLRGIN
jgi:hypothetical protein